MCICKDVQYDEHVVLSHIIMHYHYCCIVYWNNVICSIIQYVGHVIVLMGQSSPNE